MPKCHGIWLTYVVYIFMNILYETEIFCDTANVHRSKLNFCICSEIILMAKISSFIDNLYLIENTSQAKILLLTCHA